jgi:hypothetical protein
MKGKIMKTIYIVARMFEYDRKITHLMFASLDYEKAKNFFSKQVENYDNHRDKIIEPHYFIIYEMDLDTPNSISEIK